MDKYGAMNVQASLRESEEIIVNEAGMEKDVSDTSVSTKDSEDKCVKQHDCTVTDKTTECRK